MTLILCQEVPFTKKRRKTAFLPYQPMQFGTSISCFHVRSATAESAVISRPAYAVYGSCGSRNFPAFEHRVAVFTVGLNSECKCWSRFSFGVYGSKTVFSLPFFKYCSKVQTVSEKKFSLGPQRSIRGINFWCIAPITREGRKTAFAP